MSDYTTLTDSDLAAAERNYRRTMLEGGGGYNPCTAERQRRQAEAEAARPKSRDEIRHSLLRKLNALDCSIARESGTYDQAKIDGLHKQLADLDAQDAAEFAAEWTRETTMQRREAWNNRVRSGEFSGRDGHIEAARAQAQQDWSISDLQAAIKLHGL